MANLQSTAITGSLTAGSGADGNGYLMKATDGSIFRVIDPTATGGISTVNIGAIGTSTGNVRIHATDVLFLSNAGNAERLRVTSGGIKFPSSASSLNYYEEGNWTPQLAWNSGTYVMSGINSGRYVRIGNLVHLQFQLQWSSLSGSAGGTLRVNGIPFAAGGTCRSAGVICANNSIVMNAGYSWLAMTIDPNASFIYIIENAPSGGYTHGPGVNSSGIVYSLTITYSVT